jgi:hypothetical protein
MQKKHSKRIGIVFAILLGGTGIFLFTRWLRSVKNKGITDLPDSIVQSQASLPVKATAPSLFPLKIGSPKNDLVKQLQGLLGVSADGIWGGKTQAAFTALTGKTQIANQTEFDNVISSLQTKAAANANSARATDLTKQWTDNISLQLMTGPKIVSYFGVSKDAYGALNVNNDNGFIPANTKISRLDAKPLGTTTMGFLLVQKPDGKLYKVDATRVTVA